MFVSLPCHPPVAWNPYASCPSVGESELDCMTTSRTMVGLHPALRILASTAKRYISRCGYAIRHCDFVIYIFVNFLKQICIILEHSYLFCGRTVPSLALLHAKLLRNLVLSHDYKSRIQKLRRMAFYSSLCCCPAFIVNIFPFFRGCKRPRRCAIQVC